MEKTCNCYNPRGQYCPECRPTNNHSAQIGDLKNKLIKAQQDIITLQNNVEYWKQDAMELGKRLAKVLKQ